MISVILTAYNCQDYILDTIDKILLSDFSDLELIIVDDGSDDPLCKIDKIKNSIESDPRIRLFSPGRIGRANALNLGIMKAKGRFIGINDADDWPLPNRFTAQREVLNKHPELSFVCGEAISEKYSAFQAIYKKTKNNNPDNYKIRSISILDMYKFNPVIHSTIMFKKDFFLQVGGYNPHIGLCIDYELLSRMVKEKEGGIIEYPVELRCLNSTSFFKRRSYLEYILTVRRIKKQIRSNAKMPWHFFLYDIRFYLRSYLRLIYNAFVR